MYTLDFVSVSSGVSKSGSVYNSYYLYYSDSAKRGFVSQFFDNSVVIIGDQSLKMGEALPLLQPGMKFSIYNGEGSFKVFRFQEV